MAIISEDGAEARPLLDRVVEDMPVVDREGIALGVVEAVEDGRLTILCAEADRDRQQNIAKDWIAAVDTRVRLNHSADEARRLWAVPSVARPSARPR